ncbi:UNVERIFIED_CONTAM: hypothetical protein FO487_11570 [Bacillus amyloliquefaciens DSM 7 = ATCC 23350]|nr:hypothetical protein BAMTA208_12195 [Bacillus amyloliquefaciens TA208]AIW34328.1 hypothetical protein KS08_11995 [Bacillus subtilis]OXL20013.1 hypothetical protein CFI04_11530 [Bacillus amyloliquefaciens]QDP92717.1 hypothetical protein FOG69_11595 [Bacillus amyloliquefaciens]RHX69169.1 hypothetical protein D0A23_11465 [Bacillus amyloliquefaciens]
MLFFVHLQFRKTANGLQVSFLALMKEDERAKAKNKTFLKKSLKPGCTHEAKSHVGEEHINQKRCIDG